MSKIEVHLNNEFVGFASNFRLEKDVVTVTREGVPHAMNLPGNTHLVLLGTDFTLAALEGTFFKVELNSDDAGTDWDLPLGALSTVLPKTYRGIKMNIRLLVLPEWEKS